MTRLRESFRQAREAGYRKYILFLHYPPTNILEETSPFTEIAEEYGVTAVVYSHCHGGEAVRGQHPGGFPRDPVYAWVSGGFPGFQTGAGAAVTFKLMTSVIVNSQRASAFLRTQRR